jgi:hypothetical protein
LQRDGNRFLRIDRLLYVAPAGVDLAAGRAARDGFG